MILERCFRGSLRGDVVRVRLSVAAVAAVPLLLAACRGNAAINAADASFGPQPVTSPSRGSVTLPLLWQGVERLNLLCLVSGDSGVDTALQDSICEAARSLASVGAPMPVAIIAQGDPAVLAPASVTLLIHGSVHTDSGERLLAFHLRPYRASADDSGLLFGAAPRAVRLQAGDADRRALEEALRAALAETLPWLARPAGPRPIRN